MGVPKEAIPHLIEEVAALLAEEHYEENLPRLHAEFRRACAIRARGSWNGVDG